MSLTRNLPAWLELIRASIRWHYMYRFNALFGIALTGISIYLITLVWKTAYGAQSEVAGIAIGQALTYLTIANLQLYFLRPELSGDIQARIREGQIGFDLSRPVSYPSQLFATAMGDFIGQMPLLLVALPIALTAGELSLPPTATAGIGYLLSLFLAWVIAVQLNMLIGLVSFWTLEMTGFEMMYRLIGNFATGALVPLWFMPDALRAIIQVLPFQAIVFVPVSIYIGEPATGALWSALLLQAGWGMALVFVIRWVWSKAFRHTVIQGG